MPPSTTVCALSTSTCVLTWFVSILGTPLKTWPTESWFTFSVMMIRSSGVICGVTSSDSTASLNDTDVAPLLDAS